MPMPPSENRGLNSPLSRSAARPQVANWKFALRALRSRNYRLFFIGQSVSLIGTWMTQIATSWLVYRLTGSAWLLGIVGLIAHGYGTMSYFFLLLFVGPLMTVGISRLARASTSECAAEI